MSSQTNRKKPHNGQFDRFLEAVGPVEKDCFENENLFREFDLTFSRLASMRRESLQPCGARQRKAPSPSLTAISVRSLNRA